MSGARRAFASSTRPSTNSSYSRRMAATSLLVAALALRRQRQIGELVGEGLAVAVAEPEVAEVAVAGQPQLLSELGLVEQAHLLRGGTGDRLGRLDLQAAVPGGDHRRPGQPSR